MPEIQKLRQEHAELVEIVGQLGKAITQQMPPAMVELFDIRRQLASTLIQHLKGEDWALYPQLMASSDPEIAATAKAFSDEMGGLSDAFRLYTQRWNAMSIDSNWHGFCSESKDIIVALTDRIRRENCELYPLVDRLDRAA